MADLGALQVAVRADRDVLDYLDRFYVLEHHASSPLAWTIEARLEAPHPGMLITPWNVGYHADPGTGEALICSRNATDLAITTRKIVRDALIEFCAQRGWTMLHASAVADARRIVLVVGHQGAGKTTLALDSVARHGWQLLSNDHLLLYRGAGGPTVTSLPTPLPIKIGTWSEHADWLGEPWDNGGVDLAEVRAMNPVQRYRDDQRLLYTYRQLGQPNPIGLSLEGRQVLVVLAGYAGPGRSVSAPTEVADPVAALSPHLRADWVLDPSFNTGYLHHPDRSRERFKSTSRARLAELADLAHVVEWRHQGRLAPLLTALDLDPEAIR